jgi:hypothetical protein
MRVGEGTLAGIVSPRLVSARGRGLLVALPISLCLWGVLIGAGLWIF